MAKKTPAPEAVAEPAPAPTPEPAPAPAPPTTVTVEHLNASLQVNAYVRLLAEANAKIATLSAELETLKMRASGQITDAPKPPATLPPGLSRAQRRALAAEVRKAKKAR